MKKSMKVMALLLIVLMLAGGAVMASGSGDGSGGGQDDPLMLVSSSIADGAKDVALNVKIRMEFNKNVTFDTVRAGNASAITVKDDGGKAVDAKVVLADAVNTEERNFANVEFPDGLKADTTYTLTIAQSMESKSGDNMAAPVNIEFTTAAAAAGGSSTTSNPTTGDDGYATMATTAALLYVLGYAVLKIRKRRSA